MADQSIEKRERYVAYASLCEIAAIVVLAMIVSNHSASEAWMAVVFFASSGASHGLPVVQRRTFLPEAESQMGSRNV
jgi:hypothetical protein